ncbi:hypothetical protein LIER_02150 [Lithospermum erythrorhizon]|uniref:Myb-like domain-containing protein n=1 Tax=Lithospermum erythrorhizon TaxID=34254 RepID=A0AAV3NNG2_LITER
MLSVSPDLTGPNDNINHASVRVGDGGAMVAASAEAQESGGTSGGSCGDAGGATHQGAGVVFLNEEGEKIGGGGNRWPRQETLALLKIRSDMDLAFRDSSLKGPLWEDISRKMAELGYQRNAKKCKEKFENVYKYHKRTKEGRSSKADGKTYRFFDQLQALENIIGGAQPHQQPPPLSPPPPRPSLPTVTMAVPIQVVQPTPTPPQVHQLTVSSTPQNNTVNFNNPFTSTFPQPSQPPQQPTKVVGNAVVPPSFMSNSPSSSSSTSSDEDIERRHKRKRKYKDLFESLMKTVVEKQEDFQRKFLETLEKREKSRMMREEAWRAQEMARLKNEQDLLVQERSMAAARESTLISLLQKINQHQHFPIPQNNPNNSVIKSLPQTPTPTPPPGAMNQPAPPPPPLTTPPVNPPQPIRELENSQRQENNGGGSETYFNTSSSASSSRWPKAEIDALINLRTHLDNKYQENGPKGPLWEEISSEMKKIGYNRNAKRCKEKWENINKYFKKVKESNKRRPEDSKTCPYFHQLEALYKEKEKYEKPANPTVPIIMARPEQQWPLSQEHRNQQQEAVAGAQVQVQLQHQQHHHAMEEREGENNDEEYDDEDDEDDEEDEGSAYEVVTNKQPSSVTSTA